MIKDSDLDRQELFEKRKTKFEEVKYELQQKSNIISTIRIVFFIASIIILIYLANERIFRAVLLLVFIFPILFGFFINYHNKIRHSLNKATFLTSINEQEGLRLKLNLQSFDQGKEFINPLHPYTSDLNIFGKHSLFQLINRTVTIAGKALLAKVLETPEKREVILLRQIATRELAQKIEWRQEFEAAGMNNVNSAFSINYIYQWVKESSQIKNKGLINIAAKLLPILFILSIVGFFVFELSGYVIIFFIIVNAFLLSSLNKIVSKAVEKTDTSASVLKTYSLLLQAIENEEFSSPYLIELKRRIGSSGESASHKIKRLSTILANLEMRKNPYFSSTINIMLLWDIQWMLELEKWKVKVKDDIEKWLIAINEFEMLNSFAGLSFAYPHMVFPEIKEDDFIVNGKSIAHPLISNTKRIDNAIEISGLGKILVVTGSNMSGKSTYMRTIGINGVLALVGSPVLADSFSISEMDIFTCMHIHDSLEEETSSFYAELKRINQLIRRLAEPKPVLFLLDELLKGTNSVDRNLGAKALIKQLHRKIASGLISTHDLELGQMEEELPGFVKNYSFNSSIINDEIIFDYKLRDGICHSFNASKLMEKMGIEL